LCVLFITQILTIIYATRNGISEAELYDLIAEMTETFWSLISFVLQEYFILRSVSGLLVLANDEVGHHVCQLSRKSAVTYVWFGSQ